MNCISSNFDPPVESSVIVLLPTECQHAKQERRCAHQVWKEPVPPLNTAHIHLFAPCWRTNIKPSKNGRPSRCSIRLVQSRRTVSPTLSAERARTAHTLHLLRARPQLSAAPPPPDDSPGGGGGLSCNILRHGGAGSTSQLRATQVGVG